MNRIGGATYLWILIHAGHSPAFTPRQLLVEQVR
jgi:hypothetical protein